MGNNNSSDPVDDDDTFTNTFTTESNSYTSTSIDSICKIVIDYANDLQGQHRHVTNIVFNTYKPTHSLTHDEKTVTYITHTSLIESHPRRRFGFLREELSNYSTDHHVGATIRQHQVECHAQGLEVVSLVVGSYIPTLYSLMNNKSEVTYVITFFASHH